MKKKFTVVFILLAGLLLTAGLFAKSAQAADYIIDTKKAHASINFRVSHLGFSWVMGRFNTFAGTFSYDEKHPEKSTLNVTIDTASIDSNHAERDKHLRGKDFLNVKKFPKATFVSTGVFMQDKGRMVIQGNFTLNGVTKYMEIKALKIGEGKDPWGGYRAGFRAETTFFLHEYGITYDLGPASKSVQLLLVAEGIRQ